MSCAKEILDPYKKDNPATTRTLVTIDSTKKYRLITVFNETDQAILVEYKTIVGDAASFYVPKSGRVFTRVINGTLMSNSLYITSLNNAGTGTVFINLGN